MYKTSCWGLRFAPCTAPMGLLYSPQGFLTRSEKRKFQVSPFKFRSIQKWRNLKLETWNFLTGSCTCKTDCWLLSNGLNYFFYNSGVSPAACSSGISTACSSLAANSRRVAASTLTFAALFVVAAAAHCAQRNSSDKKNFFHDFNALKGLCFRVISKNAAKLAHFLHISKKNSIFAKHF